jgi:hypothetical protein
MTAPQLLLVTPHLADSQIVVGMTPVVAVRLLGILPKMPLLRLKVRHRRVKTFYKLPILPRLYI